METEKQEAVKELTVEQMQLMAQQQMMLRAVQPSGQLSFFTQFDAVRHFHAGALGRGLAHLGNIEDPVNCTLLWDRWGLIDEEVNKELKPLIEKIVAIGSASLEQKAAMLDHICDSIYVLIGLAHNLGLPIDTGFALVHQANMDKVARPGGPIFREPDGKVMKPEGWVAPDQQIWQACFRLYAQRTSKPTNMPQRAEITETQDMGASNSAIEPEKPQQADSDSAAAQ